MRSASFKGILSPGRTAGCVLSPAGLRYGGNLVEVRRPDGHRLAALPVEAGRNQLAAEPERVEWILEHGERLWSELVLQIPGEQKSPLRRLARGQRALLAERAETYRERAELAGQWLGSSSAHWSLQTPEGETVRSEDLRDRFVVECFWRADSLWSLRSLATLRRLQEQLPADAFRIVCLNLDADVTAGRRAAEQCGGGLTHVLSGPPVGGKPPRELPVWRILDDRSTVVRVYFGWQPTLAGKILSLRR